VPTNSSGSSTSFLCKRALQFLVVSIHPAGTDEALTSTAAVRELHAADEHLQWIPAAISERKERKRVCI